jgi:hypothetical protein
VVVAVAVMGNFFLFFWLRQAGAPHRCVWGTEEWQWLNGSGTVGKGRSARFERCELERVTVYIGGGNGGGSDR